MRADDIQQLRKLFREPESVSLASEPVNPTPWGHFKPQSFVEPEKSATSLKSVEKTEPKSVETGVEQDSTSEEAFVLSSRRVSERVPGSSIELQPHEEFTASVSDIRGASGVLPAKNRRNSRRHSLWRSVFAALFLQTAVFLVAATALWHGGGREWLRNQLNKDTANVVAKPSSSLLTENFLSIFSTLTDNALLTDDRTYLDELRNLYLTKELDDELMLFAKNKEGLLLATYRDRARTHRLQLKNVLPTSPKSDESQLGVADLVSVLGNNNLEPVDRGRAAYLLGTIGDNTIASTLVEIVETDKNLHVVIAAFHSFCSVTGYEPESGLDAPAMRKWWDENGAKSLANH